MAKKRASAKSDFIELHPELAGIDPDVTGEIYLFWGTLGTVSMDFAVVQNSGIDIAEYYEMPQEFANTLLAVGKLHLLAGANPQSFQVPASTNECVRIANLPNEEMEAELQKLKRASTGLA